MKSVLKLKTNFPANFSESPFAKSLKRNPCDVGGPAFRLAVWEGRGNFSLYIIIFIF